MLKVKYFNVVTVLKDGRAVTTTNFRANTYMEAYQYGLEADEASNIASVHVSERELYNDAEEGIEWEDVEKLIQAYEERSCYREDTAYWYKENENVSKQIDNVKRKAGKL